jgi:hypothetical protein
LTDTITQADIDESKGHDVLGPAYFASRRIVDAAMEQFMAKELEPLVKASVDQFYMKLQEAVETSLWEDSAWNLQNKMWHMVDEMVRHLLAGERWAIERYALAERYDGEKIRAALAKLIPQEIQALRIADLEAEVMVLRERLEMWQRR